MTPIEIGAYKVELVVDNDGHLNVHVTSIDGSDLVEVESDDISATQSRTRFSTQKIENSS